MGRKDYNKITKNKKKGDMHRFLLYDDNYITQEKNRARDLRKSKWWRNKLSLGICHYCGNKFSKDLLTMDHIIPLSRGGTSERFNIVPACKDCNNKKKNLLPAEWEEYLQRLKNTKI